MRIQLLWLPERQTCVKGQTLFYFSLLYFALLSLRPTLHEEMNFHAYIFLLLQLNFQD
jgi:hypothetical protein